MDQTLLEILNSQREEIISKKYELAVSELKSKLAIDPLGKEFIIYNGVETPELAIELAARFVNDGIKAVVRATGIFTTSHHLVINLNSLNEVEKSQDLDELVK